MTWPSERAQGKLTDGLFDVGDVLKVAKQGTVPAGAIIIVGRRKRSSITLIVRRPAFFGVPTALVELEGRTNSFQVSWVVKQQR